MSGPSLVERDVDGVAWVRVDDVDHMPPFLVSVVSPSDQWLYASSRGGLVAGRRSPDHALFPYLTDDRLHRSHHDYGPWTLLRVRDARGVLTTWEPFVPRSHAGVRRHLRKSVAGDQLVFEEQHLALGLVFRYRWAFSERFGLVRTCTLDASACKEPLHVSVVDGLQGLLPPGAPLGLVQTASCLVDAYCRAEWDAEGELALINLEALPSDRAEPAESLRATVAWCAGLDARAVLLSRDQLDGVAGGQAPVPETLVTGRAGAFFVASTFDLDARGSKRWHVVSDVGRSHAQVAALRLRDRVGLNEAIEAEVRASTAALDGLLADVDGLQRTGDATLDAHHRANALFNAMRGGVPLQEQRVAPADLRALVSNRNRPCYARHGVWLDALGDAPIEVGELLDRVRRRDDPDLLRLAHELLPLWFGRRHGDPSRPWNRFDVRVRDAAGERLLAWEGNWRDVFQNWEALLLTHPELTESVIAVFLSASTRDGYNPYRITSEGVDWEVPEADSPWSNLGYWGDHQVAYLTRLLELSLDHHPQRLRAQLREERFACADVPYRLRPHAQQVQDPRRTVDFDVAAQRQVEARVAKVGGDGRLVHRDGQVLHLNLVEKLLLPVLAKLSCLVPGAGIWLNTQRPEWNDANNALAGYGVSVVTAAYLWRHLGVLERLLGEEHGVVRISDAASRWLDAVAGVLEGALPTTWEAGPRRVAFDALGQAATDYRARLTEPVSWVERRLGAVRGLLADAKRWLEQAVSLAHRPDGLYDGYDLLVLGDGTAGGERLYPMLEGQVAVLASGLLAPKRAADLVERLFDSALYRADVGSFMLYPQRSLPAFMAKNRLSEAHALAIPLLVSQLAAGEERVLLRDAQGALRFAPELRSAADLAPLLKAASEAEQRAVLDLWEQTFHHHAFTGRSGTMHAYEGLGSVYWHMVGKLLVAVQEAQRDAHAQGDRRAEERLASLALRVRDGLGFRRSAKAFGAIPTDPYSHTPAGRGAQQPGMTGLVKEELLSRRHELGVEVRDGCLSFDLSRVDAAELLPEATSWVIPAGVRPARTVHLPAGGLGFLLAGVPVVYQAGPEPLIELWDADEQRVELGTTLDALTSARIFRRDPDLQRIVVRWPRLGRPS